MSVALTRALVEHKVAALFPADTRNAVLAELDRYPGDTAAGRARVQLAVLRLSGSDASLLRDHVDLALRDFRDVLAPAEYPRQTAMGFAGMNTLSDGERTAIVEEDRAQWLAWLRE